MLVRLEFTDNAHLQFLSTNIDFTYRLLKLLGHVTCVDLIQDRSTIGSLSKLLLKVEGGNLGDQLARLFHRGAIVGASVGISVGTAVSRPVGQFPRFSIKAPSVINVFDHRNRKPSSTLGRNPRHSLRE